MKTLLTSFAALLAGIVALVQAASPSGNVTFVWTDTNSPGLVQSYCIYWSPTVTLPMSNWVKVATIPAPTNQFTTNIAVGENYFAMTCSNWWGESPFSVIASTPPLASAQVSLAIRRNP